METVKAEPYRPKTWAEEKQEELANMDRLVEETRAWLGRAKRAGYINTEAAELGEAIIQLQIVERRRGFLRSAIKQVAALQRRIDFIQSHH